MTYYFTPEDYSLIIKIANLKSSPDDKTWQPLLDKIARLHTAILSDIQKEHFNLHPSPEAPGLISASSLHNGEVLILQYLRYEAQAIAVERLMGRETINTVQEIDTFRHPLIELRLTPSGLAVEFIMSPDAWWDQQNMVGKLSLDEHRQQFYHLLKQLKSDFALGFWRGTHLSDMHLKTNQFQHQPIITEFLSTFQPNKDWFRLGIWYGITDDALSEDKIVGTLMQNIRDLMPFYQYFLWTSDNNYRNFYEASVSK